MLINSYVDNPKALDEFQAEVNAVLSEVKQNYVAKYTAMTLPQKFWHTLKLNLFHKRTPHKEQTRIKKESEHWFTAQ